MTALAAVRGGVRPAEADDLPRIAALHRRVFERPPGMSEDGLETLLGELFFGHPWDREAPTSLLSEDGGELVGCLGIMPRPMSFDGVPIVAAVGHNFMVDPRRRSTMAAVELMRAFLAGPQELSLAEGNEASRRLWTAMGGSISTAHSLRWLYPLRPAGYALSVLARRGGWRRLAAPLRPLGALADLAARRLPALRPRRRELTVAPLDPAALADGIRRFAAPSALGPRYDPAALGWMLDTLALGRPGATLRSALLRRGPALAGWTLYHSRPGGVAEAVQVGATEHTAGPVLDHLFADARAHGALAVSGQLTPLLLPALTERLCLVHRGRATTWLLAASRDDRILHAIHRGDAFLTHLEGEFWV